MKIFLATTAVLLSLLFSSVSVAQEEPCTPIEDALNQVISNGFQPITIPTELHNRILEDAKQRGVPATGTNSYVLVHTLQPIMAVLITDKDGCTIGFGMLSAESFMNLFSPAKDPSQES